jgi:hypothetical protein
VQNDIEIAQVRASMTGLSRYLDTGSKLLDARKSAEAVRAILDEAIRRLTPAKTASESASPG